MNITITKGYPSKYSETAGLLKDQFVKTPGTSTWYDMYTEKTFQDLRCFHIGHHWTKPPAIDVMSLI